MSVANDSMKYVLKVQRTKLVKLVDYRLMKLLFTANDMANVIIESLTEIRRR